jgi:hypothetical protein
MSQCDLILDIYVSISFQWYKELFKSMGFDPCNRSLKIWESIWDSNSHNGNSLGSVRVHSLTLLALLGACEVTLELPSWLATLQPPCFGHEPKVRIATILVSKKRHVSNGQWTFHDVPCVIILVEELVTIEINPMNFLFWKNKNN